MIIGELKKEDVEKLGEILQCINKNYQQCRVFKANLEGFCGLDIVAKLPYGTTPYFNMDLLFWINRGLQKESAEIRENAEMLAQFAKNLARIVKKLEGVDE